MLALLLFLFSPVMALRVCHNAFGLVADWIISCLEYAALALRILAVHLFLICVKLFLLFWFDLITGFEGGWPSLLTYLVDSGIFILYFLKFGVEFCLDFPVTAHHSTQSIIKLW